MMSTLGIYGLHADFWIESLSKTIGDLSSIVNNHDKAGDGSMRNSRATFDAVASKVNELQSQLTILNMATSHAIDNGVPKHNQALEAQVLENQALRKQIMELRREFVKSTSTILEANDDFTTQVQTLSDRTMLLERKAERKVNELHDVVETCRGVMDVSNVMGNR